MFKRLIMAFLWASKTLGNVKNSIGVVKATFFNAHCQVQKPRAFFIIGGSTQARYELDDMEAILGKELKLDKTNAVRVNKIYCFDGTNANAWEKARRTNPKNPVKADIIDKNGHFT